MLASIYGDNLAANKLAKENCVTSGNQYIYLPYHYTQELVRGGNIRVPHVRTKLNIADLHTKSVSKEVMDTLLRKACGYDPPWYEEMKAAHAQGANYML